MWNYVNDTEGHIVCINLFKGIFVECEAGYFGTNCSSRCPYNSYGKECQMVCKCPEDSCNFAVGCQEDKLGNLLRDNYKRNYTKY